MSWEADARGCWMEVNGKKRLVGEARGGKGAGGDICLRVMSRNAEAIRAGV